MLVFFKLIVGDGVFWDLCLMDVGVRLLIRKFGNKCNRVLDNSEVVFRIIEIIYFLLFKGMILKVLLLINIMRICLFVMRFVI